MTRLSSTSCCLDTPSFDPISYFGLFKKHYRRQDHVDDMADLADCVRHTFVFDQSHPGVMKMKTMPSDTNPIKVTMLRAGVTVQPPEGTGANPSSTSGKVSSLPFNNPPGPSTAIRHSRVMSLQKIRTVKAKMKTIVVFLAGGNGDPGLS
ncbi:hypothetical protein EMCRGX_G008691 [Ephydatia muelleri]